VPRVFPKIMTNATLQNKCLQLCSTELSAEDETTLDQDLLFVVSSLFNNFIDRVNN
jgi:hypothetical protein